MFVKFMIILCYIVLLIAIGLLIAYFKKSASWFTTIFIFCILLVAYMITDNLVSVFLASVGLILTNLSLLPFFNPIAVKIESKEKFITCMYKNGKLNPFDKTKDVSIQKPEIDCYVHNDEIYTIKLPLIPIFNSISIPFPLTNELTLDYSGIIKYGTSPFIENPQINGNVLTLNLKASAWTVTEINYPIHYTQKISEKPNVGFGPTSYLYPYTKEDNIEAINKMDEYGIVIYFRNNEQVPLHYIEFLSSGDVADSVFWKNYLKNHYSENHLQVTYINGDIIGIYNGYFYCRIHKVERLEQRYYYISSKGEGRILNY